MPSELRIESFQAGQGLETVRSLRYRVLREPLGMPFETTLFSHDDAPTTLHFVATLGRSPVGCVTLLVPDDVPCEVQLRGMAVVTEHQQRGVGSALLHHIHALAQRHGWRMWCNARAIAVPFYERHGWRCDSKPFDIPPIGPHYVMRWEQSR